MLSQGVKMYDVIIIGGGIVGCATAYYLSFYQLKVVLLEKDNDVANATTKANSAILHAGYDPGPQTLMARHNVAGAKLARELCQKLDVPYRQCGALVIGFDEKDLKTIESLYDRGIVNGVGELSILSREEALKLEPQLNPEVKGALLAGSSAIVSPWEFALALAEVAVRNGVELKLNNEVSAIEKKNGIFSVKTSKSEYQSRFIINAAGVHADEVHELIGQKEFSILPSRGEYYLLDKSEGSRCERTIFQCPNENGKGVLVSPTVHGNLIVGPNTEASSRGDVSTVASALEFVKAQALKSIPGIDFRENIRNFSGIRAKSDRHDFIIEESRSVENFYNLAGIQSPGLTAAPSIALAAVSWLKEKMTLTEKENTVDERKRLRFKDLSFEEKNLLIRKNPAYGKIVCRCESITEAEILQCFDTPVPAVSIDGVKRRCNSGMGRCQGGFCGERITNILIEKLAIEPTAVLQDKEGSNIIVSLAKEES